MKELSVRRRRKRVGGADSTEGGPQQLQLVSIQDTLKAGYELADLVLERERLEENKLVAARRQRARIKEIDNKLKELSVALHERGTRVEKEPAA